MIIKIPRYCCDLTRQPGLFYSIVSRFPIRTFWYTREQTEKRALSVPHNASYYCTGVPKCYIPLAEYVCDGLGWQRASVRRSRTAFDGHTLSLRRRYRVSKHTTTADCSRPRNSDSAFAKSTRHVSLGWRSRVALCEILYSMVRCVSRFKCRNFFAVLYSSVLLLVCTSDELRQYVLEKWQAQNTVTSICHHLLKCLAVS